MAIHPVNSGNVANSVPTSKSANKTPDAKNIATSAVSTDDTVSFSNSVLNASESDNNAPSVDQARVAAIKNALQSGNYQIDPEKIAAKMMAFEQQLPNDTT